MSLPNRALRLLLTLMATFAVQRAQAAPPSVAVSYFDNNTGKAELDPLAKGLTDMLITDLSQLSSLRIVERQKLNQVLDELKLSRSKFIDPKTAQRLGKGLAAQFILSGGYTLVGDALRIDARVFNVQTAAVLTSQRVEGSKDEFFALEKEIADLLIAALSVKLAPGERSKLRTNPTQSFDAWSAYARGLDAQDRGDAARARAEFEKALAADPNYRAARNASERLAVVFARNASQTEGQFDATFRDLDAKAPDFVQRVDALLASLDSKKLEQLNRKLALLTWLGKRNLLACARTSGPAQGNPNLLSAGIPQGGLVSHCPQVQ
ncbi:MAG TPA: FlgO family outer membrane protein, partial [Polyangiales bacterium]